MLLSWWDGLTERNPSKRRSTTMGFAALNPSCEAVVATRLLRGGPHRYVRLEERTHLVDDALPQLLRLPPRKDGDFGIGRERRDVDRRLQRMRRRIVGQHEDRRLAIPDEVARHAVEEIGLR